MYGKELIIDLHNCKTIKFNRPSLQKFFIELCNLINMEPCDLHFWDYQNSPKEYDEAPAHLKGISAIQFIKTSNITVHTLDELKCAYINIFSCKDFDTRIATKFCCDYFQGDPVNIQEMTRL